MEDNSGALPQDVLDALQQITREGIDTSKRLGFGLSGIIRRLQIMFPNQFTFHVYPLQGHCKRIEISIPAITQEEYEKTDS